MLIGINFIIDNFFLEKDSDDEEDEGEEEQGEEEQGEEKAAESEEENESEEDTAKDEDEENLKSSETETTKTECNDMTNEQPSTSKSEPGSSNATNAENGEKNEEDEDDRTNIEIAYEVLITAKNIYSEHLHEKEVRINYAEALQKLGEISIDWENLDGAIEYLNECLKHRREVLEPDDRLIAFTYHYLGLAYSFKHECDLSNKCFQSALDVIHLRIDNLKTKQKAGFDPMEKGILENEIEQLESLVPEIQAKIEDVKEQISSHFKAMAALAKETKEEEMRKFQTDFQPKPVTVINHLIKRKVGVLIYNLILIFLIKFSFYLQREDNDDNTTTTNGNAVGNKDSNLLKKICITTISDTTTKTTINDSSPTSTTSATMPVTSSSKLASSNSDVANEPATATTTTPQP